MRLIDTDLWIADAPLRFFGLELGTRMSVVRLPDGRLWLHSPIEPTRALLQEVAELGPVAYLVAPNRFHHLFVGHWQSLHPEAELWVAPGLERKRPDLRVHGVLGDKPEPGWAAALDQVLLRGIPLTNEVVFFHRPSATLIATDLAFHIGERSPWSTRLAFRLLGGYGSLAPTRAERLLVRNRDAFRSSLERILAWPFERAVVAHGEVSERGGREELERGYAWVLETSGRGAAQR